MHNKDNWEALLDFIQKLNCQMNRRVESSLAFTGVGLACFRAVYFAAYRKLGRREEK